MDNVMLPPWLKYPQLEKGSLGWRMGDGQGYMHAFERWKDTLSPSETAEYEALFPLPISWNDDLPIFARLPADDLFVTHWQAEGKPKYILEQLRQAHGSGTTHEFVFFWGPGPDKGGQITNTCLSQWEKATFRHTAAVYCCMEQYMMAAKASLFKDRIILEKIMSTDDPKTMKKLGRQVRGFERGLWDEWKYAIVLNGNYEKFMQNVGLRDFLIATGDKILVEASPYDRIWGVGMSKDDADIRNPQKWKGENLLGFALMEARDEIQRICKNYHRFK